MRSGFFRRSVIAAAGLLLGSLWSVPTASAQTSCVTDPVGDASAATPASGPLEYQDIVEACVTLKDGRFIFVMDVAAPLPNSPELPFGAKLLEWSFRLRTDLTTCASGFPYPPGKSTTSPELTHCAQYHVFILWDGTGFTGMFIDRTATSTGGEVVITPVSFNIKGAEIIASVDAVLVGNAQSFRWISRTETWFSELGTLGYLVIDAAPEEGTSANWPNN